MSFVTLDTSTILAKFALQKNPSSDTTSRNRETGHVPRFQVLLPPTPDDKWSQMSLVRVILYPGLDRSKTDWFKDSFPRYQRLSRRRKQIWSKSGGVYDDSDGCSRLIRRAGNNMFFDRSRRSGQWWRGQNIVSILCSSKQWWICRKQHRPCSHFFVDVHKLVSSLSIFLFQSRLKNSITNWEKGQVTDLGLWGGPSTSGDTWFCTDARMQPHKPNVSEEEQHREESCEPGLRKKALVLFPGSEREKEDFSSLYALLFPLPGLFMPASSFLLFTGVFLRIVYVY